MESSANEARYFSAQRRLRQRRTPAPAVRLSRGARRPRCSRDLSAVQPAGRLPSRKKPAGDPQFIDVARARTRRVRRESDNRWCNMEAVSEDPGRGSHAVTLSPREQECLQWVCRGKSSSDIGIILSLSPRTVDSYLEKACSKLRVRTRIEAVASAVRQGLIDPG